MDQVICINKYKISVKSRIYSNTNKHKSNNGNGDRNSRCNHNNFTYQAGLEVVRLLETRRPRNQEAKQEPRFPGLLALGFWGLRASKIYWGYVGDVSGIYWDSRKQNGNYSVGFKVKAVLLLEIFEPESPDTKKRDAQHSGFLVSGSCGLDNHRDKRLRTQIPTRALGAWFLVSRAFELEKI